MQRKKKEKQHTYTTISINNGWNETKQIERKKERNEYNNNKARPKRKVN
jgi:hypothetical protein